MRYIDVPCTRKLIDDSSQSHKSLKSNIRMFRELHKQIKVLFRNTYET